MRKATLALVTWIWFVAPAEGRAEEHGLLSKLRPSKPACNAPAGCASCTKVIPAPCAAVPAGTSCKPDQHGVLMKVKKCHGDAMTDPCQHGVLAHSYQRRTDPERKACKAEKHDHFLDWLCYRPRRSHCEKKHECCCVPPLYLFFLCSGCGAGCETCGGCR